MDQSKSILLKTQIIEFLQKKGFTDVRWDGDLDSITFHNSNLNYNSQLINQYASEIINIIDNKGFDSDEFIVRGSIIMFPKNYEDM
jgi:hypothetical protein